MPVLSEKSMKYQISCLWDQQLGYTFNSLLTSKVFREKEVSFVTGGDNGVVRVHKSIDTNGAITGFEKAGVDYETKGGSIRSLKSKNFTKFSSEDILVGDTNGLFTIITNGQILNRRSLCDSSITDVVDYTDSAENPTMVIGSSNGLLVAVTPYDVLWKCRLSEALKQGEQAFNECLSITAVHVFRMQSSSTDTIYLLVADSEKRLHFFQNDRLVLTLTIPSIVTSMCTGCFINDSNTSSDKDATASATKSTTSPGKGQRYSYDEQVAIATKSGAVFVLVNFTVVPYMNFSFPITQLKRLPASGLDDVDALLCCGYFNKLCILQNRHCVTSFETEDWIHSLNLISTEFSNDTLLLVIGCVDNSVKLLKLNKKR